MSVGPPAASRRVGRRPLAAEPCAAGRYLPTGRRAGAHRAKAVQKGLTCDAGQVGLLVDPVPEGLQILVGDLGPLLPLLLQRDNGGCHPDPAQRQRAPRPTGAPGTVTSPNRFPARLGAQLTPSSSSPLSSRAGDGLTGSNGPGIENVAKVRAASRTAGRGGGVSRRFRFQPVVGGAPREIGGAA